MPRNTRGTFPAYSVTDTQRINPVRRLTLKQAIEAVESRDAVWIFKWGKQNSYSIVGVQYTSLQRGDDTTPCSITAMETWLNALSENLSTDGPTMAARVENLKEKLKYWKTERDDRAVLAY